MQFGTITITGIDEGNGEETITLIAFDETGTERTHTFRTNRAKRAVTDLAARILALSNADEMAAALADACGMDLRDF